MDYLGYFVKSSYYRPGHVMKNPNLVALIQVVGTWFQIFWEKKMMMYFFSWCHIRYLLCVSEGCSFLRFYFAC